jgi:cytochrome oxidase Cu insertion factor (SCO1/SenC/PrrC family)
LRAFQREAAVRQFAIRFLILTIIAAPLLATGCSRQTDAEPLPDLYPVAKFSLINQDGKKVTREDLLGKVWVASFIFTRCAGPCPQITGNMASLQADLAGQDGVALVTFTVDPDYDTPPVLRRYAKTFGADPKRWSFLTGKKEPLYHLIDKGFHLGVQENQAADRTPGTAVTHSTRLVLVDRRGHVRGLYDGTDPENLKKLRVDIKALAREPS